MDPRTSLRQEIIDWLDDNYLFGDAATLIKTDDMSFLENGVLDSLGFVQLVLLIEKKHAIKIERKQLTRANFDSMNKILDYVTRIPGYR
jgi:acyl carrier protein